MTPFEIQKVKEIIKSKFEGNGTSAKIPLLKKNKFFTATLHEDGIEVDNLSSQKNLWVVFEEAINAINTKGDNGNLIKGNAMNGRLGDKRLPVESIEGHIASVVYKKKMGSSVFRRISPIAGILSWASICVNGKGYLSLKSSK